MSSETAPSPLAALETQRFRRACSEFATGVAIVTVLDGEGEPHGMTVNSFTSVSLEPPLILVCIDYRAGIFPLFRPGAVMAINVLHEDQRELSILFGRPGASRMYLTEWRPGTAGAPLLNGVIATFESKISQVVEAGDHSIVIASVHDVSFHSGRPLLYFESKYQSLA